MEAPLKKLRIRVIDLVTKSQKAPLWGRVMNANFASIMPQVVALWCERAGHDVTLTCYTGVENLADELSDNFDIVFVGAFTQSAQQAYALSHQARAKGAITVLGGPHARCYPDDARRFFDYVLGFTDEQVIRDVLHDHSRHRPLGQKLTATHQPKTLPGVRERWRFIEPTLKKAPFIKLVPMIASMGCPYTCSFCIDSVVPYQPLEYDVIKEDLRFLLKTFKRPRVGWHDPNFGIRFDECLSAIEEAVPPDSIDFMAESTLSLLSESRLRRLQRIGFKAIMPGIESWYDMGSKSKTGSRTGMDKVRQVADHMNLILKYIPYVQTNFVLGLDTDEGAEPFELTKRFLDMVPSAFPAYSLLTSFGEAAPLNLEYQRDGRVLPFPHHLLNNNHAMNVRPKNYSWPDFYDHLISLTWYSYSWPRVIRRMRSNEGMIAKGINAVRALSSEGAGRLKFYREIRRRLDTDLQMRMYFEQETADLPDFLLNRIREELGPLWEWLPEGAIYHNPKAYLDRMEPQTQAPEAAQI
jgi:hypothetical protein